MTQNIILLADDDHDFREKCMTSFSSEYRILFSTNIEQTEQILQKHRVHLLIIEVRMQDQSDAEDVSGLDFACQEKYSHIPKLILTTDPQVNHVRRALAPGPYNRPLAVNILDKKEDENLLPEIQNIFDKHIFINRNLYIHWHPKASFSYLTDLILSANSISEQSERIKEIEDLYRILFTNYQQITMGRVLLQSHHRAIVEVWTYTESGIEEYYVVLYGFSQVIQSENKSYQYSVPKNSPSGITQQSAETVFTQRFAATKYAFFGLEEHFVEKFLSFYQTQMAPEIRHLLEQLYQVTLSSWHSVSVPESNQVDLAELYQQWLALDEQKIGQLQEKTWQQRFGQEIQRLGLDKVEAVRSTGESYLTFKGLMNSLKLIKKLLVQPILKSTRIINSITHGQVTTDTVIIDKNNHTWLIDFSQAGHRPVEYDYISLEMSIRLHCLGDLDLADRYDLEEQLLAMDFDARPPTGQDHSSTDKAISAIQQIRHLAVNLHKSESQAYFFGLFYSAIAHLTTYRQDIYYSTRELLPIVHCYLLAAMIAEHLMEQSEPNDSLSFEIDTAAKQIWIDGDEIVLTSQEWLILEYLYEHRNTLQTHQQICAHAFPEKFNLHRDRTRYNTAINRLCKKVDPDRKKSKLIISHRGQGYRLKYESADLAK